MQLFATIILGYDIKVWLGGAAALFCLWKFASPSYSSLLDKIVKPSDYATSTVDAEGENFLAVRSKLKEAKVLAVKSPETCSAIDLAIEKSIGLVSIQGTQA